jgi:hypothetical protein
MPVTMSVPNGASSPGYATVTLASNCVTSRWDKLTVNYLANSLRTGTQACLRRGRSRGHAENNTKVGWPTEQMVCSWHSTQTAAGCVHFQMSHCSTVHVTSFTPKTKARPFKTPTNGQQQRSYCHRQWSRRRQACHSYVQRGFHWTVLEKNKSVLKILYRGPSTSESTKKMRKQGKISLGLN